MLFCLHILDFKKQLSLGQKLGCIVGWPLTEPATGLIFQGKEVHPGGAPCPRLRSALDGSQALHGPQRREQQKMTIILGRSETNRVDPCSKPMPHVVLGALQSSEGSLQTPALTVPADSFQILPMCGLSQQVFRHCGEKSFLKSQKKQRQLELSERPDWSLSARGLEQERKHLVLSLPDPKALQGEDGAALREAEGKASVSPPGLRCHARRSGRRI